MYMCKHCGEIVVIPPEKDFCFCPECGEKIESKSAQEDIQAAMDSFSEEKVDRTQPAAPKTTASSSYQPSFMTTSKPTVRAKSSPMKKYIPTIVIVAFAAVVVGSFSKVFGMSDYARSQYDLISSLTSPFDYGNSSTFEFEADISPGNLARQYVSSSFAVNGKIIADKNDVCADIQFKENKKDVAGVQLALVDGLLTAGIDEYTEYYLETEIFDRLGVDIDVIDLDMKKLKSTLKDIAKLYVKTSEKVAETEKDEELTVGDEKELTVKNVTKHNITLKERIVYEFGLEALAIVEKNKNLYGLLEDYLYEAEKYLTNRLDRLSGDGSTLAIMGVWEKDGKVLRQTAVDFMGNRGFDYIDATVGNNRYTYAYVYGVGNLKGELRKSGGGWDGPVDVNVYSSGLPTLTLNLKGFEFKNGIFKGTVSTPCQYIDTYFGIYIPEIKLSFSKKGKQQSAVLNIIDIGGSEIIDIKLLYSLKKGGSVSEPKLEGRGIDPYNLGYADARAIGEDLLSFAEDLSGQVIKDIIKLF